jgi:hypothetical protein
MDRARGLRVVLHPVLQLGQLEVEEIGVAGLDTASISRPGQGEQRWAQSFPDRHRLGRTAVVVDRPDLTHVAEPTNEV